MADDVVSVGTQPWRMALTALVFVSLFATVGWRLHELQMIECDRLTEKGENQRTRTLTIEARRGGIYAGDAVPMAISEGTWTVLIDASYMDDRQRATVELSRALAIDRDLLRKELDKGSNGRRIAKGLSDEQAEQIRALKLNGVYLRRDYQRTYPEGGLAPHVLGMVQSDGTGGAGIEQQFNAVLTGHPGHETMMVDALGHPSLIDGECTAAEHGANVQLTIDVVVQRELEAAIAAAVEKHHPTNAAGIVVRPATGEVLGLVSWPTFTPLDLSTLPDGALRNNVLSFVYEPGSTMKPLIAGAAVAERLASWNESIFCENGRWTYREGRAARTVTDHSVNHGGHQNLTVVQGIALSDNILMSKLGIRLGVNRLYDWVTRCHFGHKSGIVLPGEDCGIMLAKPHWTTMGSCISIAFGHEIAVTPLQMAMAHAMIANRGVWQPPRLVSRIWRSDPAGGADEELPLPVLPESHAVFTPADAAQIQDAMTHVMDEGTGKAAQLDGYSSAGKTGTAEKLINGHYSNEHHVGSFVCWAPANGDPQRKPEVLVLVVIDDSKQNGHYGAETAAPVVQRVLQATLEHLHVPHDLPTKAESDAATPVRGRRTR